MDHLLFNGWDNILRTALMGVLAYATLVLLLRVSGKRTLSKMNAFDFVVTVALGSTLASALLSKDVSLAQGAAAFGVLIGLQFVVTWLSVRSRWVRSTIVGEPQIVFYRGCFLDEALRRARVTQDEVLAAIRAAGHSHLASVQAVVLETNASFSVITHGDGTGEALSVVHGWRDAARQPPPSSPPP